MRWIRSHPRKPLENELFLGQSNGMARWLKLAVASDEGCGISAGIDFQLPARILWRAYRTVLGEEQTPYESAYDKERLTWRLLKLLPCLMEDERFAPLNMNGAGSMIPGKNGRPCRGSTRPGLKPGWGWPG